MQLMPDLETMLINEADLLSYAIYDVRGEQLTTKLKAIEIHAVYELYSLAFLADPQGVFILNILACKT